jgi:hypothetical protein
MIMIGKISIKRNQNKMKMIARGNYKKHKSI